MPDLRSHVSRDRATLDDSDTFELDLKGFSSISAIDIIIRGTNGATSNQGVPLNTDIDTIEVVNGSQVIHSLSGVQSRVLNTFEQRNYPSITLDEQAAAVQEEIFRVSFGRWVGDDQYWMRPSDFANPMLKVTNSLTISAAAGFATGTGRITVIVWTWDEAPANRRGHFLTKEYKSFTSAASGDDRTDLPRDFPYRLVVFRGFETAVELHTDLTNIKLTLDNDRLIPLDMRTEQLRDLNAEWFGMFSVPQIVFRTDADAPDSFLAYPREFQANALLDLDLASIDVRTVNELTIQLLSVTVVPAIAKSIVDTAINLVAKGYGPHHSLAYPFGRMNDPESWFDPTSFGKFEAVLTQGGAGAAVSIFGQQIMP